MKFIANTLVNSLDKIKKSKTCHTAAHSFSSLVQARTGKFVNGLPIFHQIQAAEEAATCQGMSLLAKCNSCQVVIGEDNLLKQGKDVKMWDLGLQLGREGRQLSELGQQLMRDVERQLREGGHQAGQGGYPSTRQGRHQAVQIPGCGENHDRSSRGRQVQVQNYLSPSWILPQQHLIWHTLSASPSSC